LTRLTSQTDQATATGPRTVSVNVGRGRDANWAGQLRRTAIDKRSVDGPVIARRLDLDGDEQADRRHHGGVDQALYAYAAEDTDFWEQELRRPLWPEATGENLTTAGVDLTHAVIGERWRVGGTELEVSAPRTPCRVFAGFWGTCRTWSSGSPPPAAQGPTGASSPRARSPQATRSRSCTVQRTA
jgi:MOSC domain-containing protein YiiM